MRPGHNSQAARIKALSPTRRSAPMSCRWSTASWYTKIAPRAKRRVATKPRGGTWPWPSKLPWHGSVKCASAIARVVGSIRRTSTPSSVCGEGPPSRRDPTATAPRTPLLQVGLALRLVSPQKAECQGPCLEQARRQQVIGSLGGGACGRAGPPDARRRAAQGPLPALHPAVPARFGPVGVGIHRGLGDAASLPVLLVPDATQGAPHGAVHGGGPGARRPGRKQGDHGAPQTPKRGGEGGRDHRQTTRPGPAAPADGPGGGEHPICAHLSI